MRCPKCRYISFERGNRCRNCGYEFSLSRPPDPLDLPIHDRNEPVGPMADLQLGSAPPSEDVGARIGSAARDTDDIAGRSRLMARLDLPLFGEGDAPLVTPPAVPRAPLAVRRGVPAPAPPRAQDAVRPEARQLDLGTPAGREQFRQEQARRAAAESAATAATPATLTAHLGARIAAGLIDAVVLAAIDVLVLYFTLRLCDLQPADIRTLPAVPLASFLLLLNGGYFVCFTAASGQTIGKMAARIRVVTDPGNGGEPHRVSLDHAIVRAATYPLSLLPAGLGLLPALFNEDGRALHDRVAETRVVKA